MIPKDKVPHLPRSLRGAWVENTVEEWEAKVGHYGHGCDETELVRLAKDAKLEVLDRRGTHTRVTSFWLEMLFTFPLVYWMAAPLVRLLYELEWMLPPARGINLMMTFRKS
jgi:hypothetical protein